MNIPKMLKQFASTLFFTFITINLSIADVKVMAINTEWLWTPNDNNVDGDKYNQGDMSISDYNEELDFYASIILVNEAQIVALSEIENELVANDLAYRLGSNWQAYYRQGRDTATGQDVAILSNLEHVKGSTTDFNFPIGKLEGDIKGKRLSKVLGVILVLPAEHFVDSKAKTMGVITSHFLSKRNDSKRKSLNRQRQGHALTKAIREYERVSETLIVLGDFNDYLGSPTINILLEKGRLQSTELVLKHPSKIKTAYRGKSIDHILYRGLRPSNYKRIDLEQYSDHFGVYGAFR